MLKLNECVHETAQIHKRETSSEKEHGSVNEETGPCHTANEWQQDLDYRTT